MFGFLTYRMDREERHVIHEEGHNQQSSVIVTKLKHEFLESQRVQIIDLLQPIQSIQSIN